MPFTHAAVRRLGMVPCALVESMSGGRCGVAQLVDAHSALHRHLAQGACAEAGSPSHAADAAARARSDAATDREAAQRLDVGIAVMYLFAVYVLHPMVDLFRSEPRHVSPIVRCL
jgi:hypothetical protein